MPISVNCGYPIKPSNCQFIKNRKSSCSGGRERTTAGDINTAQLPDSHGGSAVTSPLFSQERIREARQHPVHVTIHRHVMPITKSGASPKTQASQTALQRVKFTPASHLLAFPEYSGTEEV